ncbi:unnamed protein product [Caenorhabditis auriculariae]|uniref:Lipase_GDSL domain-containing protein n=1 Tax=Caenorhabditis auriculariae TaxID=2777116 RepID=A0A8S1H6H1_9PELO|nr:unnamed protein product [Caenorhabditis auriculariae]
MKCCGFLLLLTACFILQIKSDDPFKVTDSFPPIPFGEKGAAFIDEDDDGKPDEIDHRHAVNNEIIGAFSNKQTFACPRAKPQLHTGDNMANISPEDISIVAAMGDSLASGRGLWFPTNVEFRGAAFPIGGDATFDGLVTIPNILRQFNDKIDGVSHGMGTRDRIPDYQYNVAEAGSETDDLPAQAKELVRRMRTHVRQFYERWTLVTIAAGTEEFCARCEPPNHPSLRRTMGTLRKGIPKALVILLGPLHVSWSYKQNINLLRSRCPCLGNLTRTDYKDLVYRWKTTFLKVEQEFNSLNYTTFGVLTIPALTIHSREPETLFIENGPLLNRKGHTYAAKSLWNFLMAGPNYNLSRTIISQDSYYCPSVGCPYFRTVQNFEHCQVITEDYWQAVYRPTLPPNGTVVPHNEQVRRHLLGVIGLVTALALISVLIFGTVFYRHGMKATKGRFDYVDDVPEDEDSQTMTTQII